MLPAEIVIGWLQTEEPSPAWRVIWEVTNEGSAREKASLLAKIKVWVDLDCPPDHIAGIESGLAMEMALRDALRGTSPGPTGVETRALQAEYQRRSFSEELTAMGARPDEGIPMWKMYMARRPKRNRD